MRARDPWFDNIKMTLVTLVVVGHSWTLLPHNAVNHWTYDALYAWHVPAFVTITGYLSRSFAWTPARLWALVRTVAVPYLLFEAALAWFRYRVGGVTLDDLFADPHWPMWYLSALFFWRLMTPAFLRIPKPVALGVAIGISLTAGVWAGNILDLARIFGLLPFFVLGLLLTDREWGWLRPRSVAPYAVAGLCLTTEANLGDGIFPAVDFMAQGGRMGIGSDSHVSLSVVEELRWLEYGQRLRDQRRNRLYRGDQPMVGRTLYDAALVGGAQAMGQAVGELAVGKRADWLVLDGQDPYLATASGDGILNRWLFAGGDRQVRDVMVNGQWVVRQGRHAQEQASARAFMEVLRQLLD